MITSSILVVDVLNVHSRYYTYTPKKPKVAKNIKFFDFYFQLCDLLTDHVIGLPVWSSSHESWLMALGRTSLLPDLLAQVALRSWFDSP